MTNSRATLVERLARILHNDAHAGGLKPTQWEALRYLARANRFSRSPGALTVYLGMTKGTVSQTLQALERKGCIKKTAAKDDRRGLIVKITKKGESLLADDPLIDLDATIAALPKETKGELSSSLESLLKAILANRDGKTFGACKTCRHFRRTHKNGAPHFCSLLLEPLSGDDSERICIEQEAA